MSALRLGILTDLHRTTDPGERSRWHNEYDFAGHAARVGRALAWWRQQAVDAVILSGDLTHAASPEAMSAVLGECCGGLDVPVIAVTGNHDVEKGVDELARGIERVADARLGAGEPSGRVIAGLRIAGLHVAPALGYSRSRLLAPPAVEEWGDEAVVVISHLPLLSRASAVAAAGMPSTGDLLDREDAASLLRTRSAPTIVLSGHMHVRDAHAEGPVLQLMQGAMIEPPFDAGVVEISTDNGDAWVRRRTHRTSERRGEYEPVLTGRVGSWRFTGGSWQTTGVSDSPFQDQAITAGMQP